MATVVIFDAPSLTYSYVIFTSLVFTESTQHRIAPIVWALAARRKFVPPPPRIASTTVHETRLSYCTTDFLVAICLTLGSLFDFVLGAQMLTLKLRVVYVLLVDTQAVLEISRPFFRRPPSRQERRVVPRLRQR